MCPNTSQKSFGQNRPTWSHHIGHWTINTSNFKTIAYFGATFGRIEIGRFEKQFRAALE